MAATAHCSDSQLILKQKSTAPQAHCSNIHSGKFYALNILSVFELAGKDEDSCR